MNTFKTKIRYIPFLVIRSETDLPPLSNTDTELPPVPDNNTDPAPSDEESCGIFKPLMITESSTGEITSPGHPLPYGNDLDCQWHVNVNEGFVVQLTFIEFDVEDG